MLKLKMNYPHLAFKLRITNNVLGMVQREIDQGEQLSEEVIEGVSYH